MNPNWGQEEVIPWADSKPRCKPTFWSVEGHLAAIHGAEFIARITCHILLITADPELGAIVTPETARSSTTLATW